MNTKPRYEILDGLRGVAAVAVVLFHLLETYAADPAHQIINHGYLAVDFFFLLSGFVLGYAYDDRWGTMSVGTFFKRRIIRLQPMVVLGTLFGAALYFFGQCDGFPLIGHVPGWKFFAVIVMASLMIPCPTGMDIRGWAETNPLNGPNWTLTWEYLANILYAFVLRFLPVWALSAAVVLAGCLTLDICLNLNLLGLLTEGRDAQMYTVIGGWSLTPEQIYIGLVRLAYPFLCGLLLSRLGRSIRIEQGFLWSSLLLLLVLAVPCVGGAGNILNGVYNAAAILVLFPVIVLIGAGSDMSTGRNARICTFLGAISYPLYITHYPLLYIQMSWAWSHPEAPAYAHIVVAAGCFALSIAWAWACLKLYDLPVRKWLSDRWLDRNSRTQKA